MYVSWVLGDKLRIVMSSIMRWRRGEIGLVIGGLLSVGLHERAILADRTPPTDDPTPIGTADGPNGIYGRRSLSKPPKPTILNLSHRPHHRRLPRQRFSATVVSLASDSSMTCVTARMVPRTNPSSRGTVARSRDIGRRH